MISSDMVMFGLDWLSKNNFGLWLVLIALAQVFAIAALAYAVHVLGMLMRRKK